MGDMIELDAHEILRNTLLDIVTMFFPGAKRIQVVFQLPEIKHIKLYEVVHLPQALEQLYNFNKEFVGLLGYLGI